MNLLRFVCLLVSLSACKSLRISREVSPTNVEPLDGFQYMIFSQKLNHFSNATPIFWQQRYYVNTDLWSKTVNSPVFLMVTGEQGAQASFFTSGAWLEWARKYRALLFQLEHRFYGRSNPTRDTSVENLQYLSSEQALADTTYFIQQITLLYKLTPTNKWILFGGSYPANLVAWARLKYPNLVYGSVSSSPPLQAKLNFFEYMNVVRTSLDYYSPGCSSNFTLIIKTIQQRFTTSDGPQSLMKKFNVCSGFDSRNPKDLNQFYGDIVGPVTQAVQYNNIGGETQKISYVCSYLTSPNIPDIVDRLATIVNQVYNGVCLTASYQAALNYYRSTGWNDSAVITNIRQWLYQTCNEFGYFQTSDSTNSLASNTIPLEFFTQQCTDVFGSNYNARQLTQAIYNTNQYYQGTNIVVDRVVFVQGSVDPWHALGNVQSTRESPLINITGTTHCQDMLQPKQSDIPELTNARGLIDKYLEYWILKSN